MFKKKDKIMIEWDEKTEELKIQVKPKDMEIPRIMKILVASIMLMNEMIEEEAQKVKPLEKGKPGEKKESSYIS